MTLLRKPHLLALLIVTSFACADHSNPLGAPSTAGAASQIEILDNGTIQGVVLLPFDFSPDGPGEWWRWGRYPAHEEIFIPEGLYEVDFEVSGGFRLALKPDAPWYVADDGLDGFVVGPGGRGLNASQPEWPALRVQLGYMPAMFEGQGYPDNFVWQAESDLASPARGRVVVYGPGRLRINRHFNSSYFWFLREDRMEYYDVIQDQQLTFTARPLSGTLKLNCGTGTAVRGDSIRCVASAEPSGELSEVEWSFEGSPRSDGDVTSTEWRGQMVRGGTVRVSAKVGSTPVQTAEAMIVVQSRTWTDLPRWDRAVFGATDGDPDVPTLSTRIEWASDLGSFVAIPEAAPGQAPWEDAIQAVLGGPNDGLAYFGDLSFPVRGRIRINSAAMESGSGFYREQERAGAGGGTTLGGTWCSQRVVTTSLPALVLAHEERHETVYREHYASVVRSELSELEDLTGSYSDLADRYDALRERAHTAADSATWAIHEIRSSPNVIIAREGGRECNLKNEAGRLLENPPKPAGRT